MNDSEIEKYADECWVRWRKSAIKLGVDMSKFSEMEIWHHAYRAGFESGMDLETEECAKASERCCDSHVAQVIRLRVGLRKAKCYP